MYGHRADHQRHHCVFRDAERKQGNERRLRSGIVGRFRSSNALNCALSESARILRQFFLERISAERCKHGTPAREQAQDRTDARAAEHGRPRILELLLGEPKTADFGGNEFALLRALEVGEDLGEAEQAHGDAYDAQTVDELRDAEREARGTGIDVGADQAQQQPEYDHRNGLEEGPMRENHRTDQSEDHQRAIFRGAEL